MVSKRERLQECFRRLGKAPEAGSYEEAIDQLASIINDVEDTLTTIHYDPANWQNDGRIYPPMPDSSRAVPGQPRVRRLRSRFHNTFIGSNGAIEIQTVEGRVEITKKGADGRGVWELSGGADDAAG